MPRWDFFCNDCKTINELSFKTYEASKEAFCPQCGSENVERVPSSAHFILKGDGFYVNDYKDK